MPTQHTEQNIIQPQKTLDVLQIVIIYIGKNDYNVIHQRQVSLCVKFDVSYVNPFSLLALARAISSVR